MCMTGGDYMIMAPIRNTKCNLLPIENFDQGRIRMNHKSNNPI